MDLQTTKELIKRILVEDYINKATRFQYNTSVQERLAAMNKGLTRACSTVIMSATNNEDEQNELADYARSVINGIEEAGLQETV